MAEAKKLFERVPRIAYDHQLFKQSANREKRVFSTSPLLTLQCCLDTTVYGSVFSGVSFNRHTLATVFVNYLAKQKEAHVNKKPSLLYPKKLTVTSTADHRVNSNTLGVTEMVWRMSLKVLCTQNTQITIPRKLQLQIQVTTDTKFLYQIIHHFILFENQNLALVNIYYST